MDRHEAIAAKAKVDLSQISANTPANISNCSSIKGRPSRRRFVVAKKNPECRAIHEDFVASGAADCPHCAVN